MDVSTYITSRRAMLELELDLLDRQAGADGVDRHPRLDAEAGCEREDRRARRRREVALTRERLGRLEAAAEPDQRPCDALRDPEATALPACEPRHPHALQQTVTWQEGARVAAQVGVEEQQRARRRGPLRGRQRLPLAATREPEDDGAGLLGAVGRRVARAVVRDDHLGAGKRPAEGADRVGDRVLLVRSEER